MSYKITKQQYEELSLQDRLYYLEDSDLWEYIIESYEIFYPEDDLFREYIWDGISCFDGGWEVLTDCLQDVKEVCSYAEIVYQDTTEDCWYEWHELDCEELDSIVETFYALEEYDDLFANDEDMFEGMENLI